MENISVLHVQILPGIQLWPVFLHLNWKDLWILKNFKDFYVVENICKGNFEIDTIFTVHSANDLCMYFIRSQSTSCFKVKGARFNLAMVFRFFFHIFDIYIALTEIHNCASPSLCLYLFVTIFLIIIKFPYNTRPDWLKQRALLENRERVNDIKLAFKFLVRNFDKFDNSVSSCTRRAISSKLTPVLGVERVRAV